MPSLQKLLIPLAVAVVGGLATAAGVHLARQSLDAHEEAQFTRDADTLESEIRRRLARAQEALESLRAAHAMAGRLDSEDLRRYIARRDMAKDFPGLRGFGANERVRREDLDTFAQRQRGPGQHDFTVRSPGDHPVLYVIRSIEPAAANGSALGFDAGSNPVARAAIESAVSTGMATLSEPLVLRQDSLAGQGYVLYLPVYGGEPRSESQREEQLQLVLFAPFAARDLLEGVQENTAGRIAFRLRDTRADGPVVHDALTDSPGAATRTAHRSLLVGGRVLSLEIVDRLGPGERGAAGSLLPAVVALVGTLLTLALACGTWLLAAGRLQALGRLAAREHLLRTITDNLPAGISYWDGEGRCRFANQQMGQLLGVPAAGLLGKRVADLTPAPDAAPLLGRFEEALAGHPKRFEHQAAGADGAPATHQVHLLPDLRDGGGSGFFVLANDVTELRRARDVAMEASSAKTLFLSSMSHEIRTPMNAILGMLALLRGTTQTARQRDFTDKAEGAAKALLSLLNDVLDVAKIEAGRMELDCRPFSVDALLGDLSAILSANIGSRDLEVAYDLDPAVPDALVGDDMRLRQILINLGGNAVKFTERGHVVIGTRLVSRDGGTAQVEFSVRDTGIGISAQEQERLFGDYVQASASTTRKFGGTGLGLGICRRLTELMGSALRLDSRPGAGSTFSFVLSLPVAPSTADRPSPARVLVAGDDEVVRGAIARAAACLGWQVEVAWHGATPAAMVVQAQADGHPFDAVLVDTRLPHNDGWETRARLRRLPSGVAPRVLLLVPHGLDAASVGEVDGCLVKPATPLMLRDAVARLLDPGRAPAVATPTALPLAGVRVLVAEDNPVNQQIASELLAGEGARVELASTGREAVDRLRADPRFDCVLMDMRMPEMDGLEATRAIRGELGLAALPIVAMTANAMDSDRAECLAAGMDDHLPKPMVLADVVAAILRRLPSQAHSTPVPPTIRAQVPAPPALAPSPALATETAPAAAAAMASAPSVSTARPAPDNAPLLDKAGALARLGGDEALFNRLLGPFRNNLDRLRGELASARERDSAEEVRAVLHTIKGMAGTMGAEGLTRAAQQAEQALREGRAAADFGAGEIDALIDRTLAAFAAAG